LFLDYLKQVDFLSAALLTGFAVKIMDDYLDESIDRASRQPNLVTMFGKGVTVYGFCLLLAASVIHMPTALSIFAGAYIVGMGFSSTSTYLSGLTARAESLAMLLFSLYYAGMAYTGASLCLMQALQLWDSWVDGQKQKSRLVLAGAFIGGAFLIDGVFSIMVLSAYGIYFAIERWWQCSTSSDSD